MAILTTGTPPKPYGGGGRKIDCPVAANQQLYQGQLVAYLSGGLVPGSTAGAGDAVGVCEFDALGTATLGQTRVMVWTDREFSFNNGANAFTDATPIGSLAYMEDDHTLGTGGVGGSGEGVGGLFMGMNDDGSIRVYVFPNIAESLQWIYVNGTAIPNAATATVQSLGRLSRYNIAALSQNIAVTVGTTGAVTGNRVKITRTDTSAFTVAVVNGGPGAGTVATLDVSKMGFCEVYFDGTNWKLDGVGIA
jgi:hypothetical protein